MTVDGMHRNGPDHGPHLGGHLNSPRATEQGPAPPFQDAPHRPCGGLLHLPHPHPRLHPPSQPEDTSPALEPSSDASSPTPPHPAQLPLPSDVHTLRPPWKMLGPLSHLLDSAPAKDLGRPGGVWAYQQFVNEQDAEIPALSAKSRWRM